MDFELTHEQRLLGEMLDRLLAEQGQPGSSETLDKDRWSQLAELGVLGACFAEEDGGSGGNAIERMVVMQSLGRAGSTLPYLSTVVLGGGAIALAGSAGQREALLPQVIDGSLHVALAHDELGSRYDLAMVATQAMSVGNRYVINGTKGLINQAQHATHLVVSARLIGNVTDQGCMALFLIPVETPGVTRSIYPTHDGHGAACFAFKDVFIPLEGRLGETGEYGSHDSAWSTIRALNDAAIAAVCAEGLGNMEAAYRLTLDYLGTREQFGQKIGSFQALQHRAVDMFVGLELARSMVLYGAVMADEADPATRSRALSGVKIRVARSARHIAQEAIQLHGAIGLTEEYALGSHARRLALIEMQFGDADHHAGLLTEELPL